MFIGMAHEGSLQLMGQPLNHATAGRMPCISPGYRGSGNGSQSLEKMDLELPALVGCDLLGKTETSNPEGDEGI
jgi:hypothetical protein